MSYLPLNFQPNSNNIDFMSIESAVGVPLRLMQNITTPASFTWPVANKAIFIPFSLRKMIVATSLFTSNGSAAAGNIDIGIYTWDGTRIVHTGSTAQAGTSVNQVISITATDIGPGQFYLALSASSTSATFLGHSSFVTTLGLQRAGIYQQATALPLPANATFASASSIMLPIFGLTTQPLV